MNAAAEPIACPICGSELTLAQIFTHEDTRLAVARLTALSVPMGVRLLEYVTLFAPPKTRLTVSKQIKLILQLLPDLERKAITYRGREWAAPLTAWAVAIDQMMAARTAGRLELPMKGHAYLYSILTGLADKIEGKAEAQHEADKRAPPRQDTVQVRGEAMPIGQALQVMYSGKDPELARLEADTARAAPVPEAAREQLRRLKGGAP